MFFFWKSFILLMFTFAYIIKSSVLIALIAPIHIKFETFLNTNRRFSKIPAEVHSCNYPTTMLASWFSWAAESHSRKHDSLPVGQFADNRIINSMSLKLDYGIHWKTWKPLKVHEGNSNHGIRWILDVEIPHIVILWSNIS